MKKKVAELDFGDVKEEKKRGRPKKNLDNIEANKPVEEVAEPKKRGRKKGFKLDKSAEVNQHPKFGALITKDKKSTKDELDMETSEALCKEMRDLYGVLACKWLWCGTVNCKNRKQNIGFLSDGIVRMERLYNTSCLDIQEVVRLSGDLRKIQNEE